MDAHFSTIDNPTWEKITNCATNSREGIVDDPMKLYVRYDRNIVDDDTLTQ